MSIWSPTRRQHKVSPIKQAQASRSLDRLMARQLKQFAAQEEALRQIVAHNEAWQLAHVESQAVTVLTGGEIGRRH